MHTCTHTQFIEYANPQFRELYFSPISLNTFRYFILQLALHATRSGRNAIRQRLFFKQFFFIVELDIS